MESNVSYIKGKVGIPHNGLLKSDGKNISLEDKNGTVFSVEVGAIKRITAMPSLNLTIFLDDGREYGFSNINWSSPRNILAWAVTCLVATVAMAIGLGAVFATDTRARAIAYTVVIPIGIIAFIIYFTQLKKVPNGSKPVSTDAWRNYFAKVCPDKLR